LARDIHDVIATEMPENIPPNANDAPPRARLSTAFLQLCYPWLKTTGSWVLNESLEPPDGALVGMLARNSLTRGAFMDATKIVPAEITDVFPELPQEETLVSDTPLVWGDNSWKPLIIRLSLFGFTPTGLRLLSDVTAYPGEAYRPARVHRLVAVILRAARQLGERIVFRQNGPVLWKNVEISLTQLMTQLWRSNALEGATAKEAFTVRCDAGTMTQNDLDNGRLVAQVIFTAAATIELIRVTLGLETSGAGAQAAAPVLAEVG
jgi:phage tail sheath protein FI